MPIKSGSVPHPTSEQPKDKSRRLLLKMMGLGAGLGAGKGLAASGATLDAASLFINDSVRVTLYRPEDLLQLDLNFVGFQKSADNRSLTATSNPRFLVVVFQPQSIAEQAYEEKGGGENGYDFDSKAVSALNAINGQGKESVPGNGGLQLPAKSYLSGNSRLVFEIPGNISSIPLTAKDLLGWDRFRPLVNNRAAAPNIIPVFNAQDNVGDFNNILIKDVKMNDIKANDLPVNPPVKNEQPINRQPVQNPSNQQIRTLNQPNMRVNNVPADTVRQLQVNRELRGATKDEQQAIQRREAPRDAMVTQQDKGIIGAISNLRYGKTPRPVDESETCIEMPYRLYISPNQYGAWYHETKLKLREDEATTQVKTYELWHSRLFCKNCTGARDITDANNALKTVRALWASDINGTWSDKPLRADQFKTSLYNDDRHCIVHESSNWALPGGFVPKPVQVSNLMLSTLGAWLDAELLVKRKELESSNIIGKLNLLKWKHIATLARDHYVEVVYAGNMLPFGHEASLVRVTERKPQQNYAVNRQRYFIVINEEEKKYNPYNPNNGNFKSFPFSTVRFISTATPTIDPPARFCAGVSDMQPDHQFIPRVGGKDFLFKMMAYDLEGNEVDFEMPMVFVTTDITYMSDGGYNLKDIGAINNCYNSATGIQNKIGLHNQKMALARSHTDGDTTFEVKTIQFYSHGTIDERPGFRPEVKELEIFIAAVENIIGRRQAQRVSLVDDESNKAEAQRKNKGNVFAKLLDAADVNFNGSGSKTGGSLSPNFSITCLSKTLGAVGGKIEDLQNMKFDPEAFFDESAKLFGVIGLGKIIHAVDNAVAFVNGSTVQSPIPALKNIDTPEALITQYSWNAAKLKPWGNAFVKFQPHSPDATGKVVIETKLYRYKDPTKSMALEVNSHIDDFGIEIASLASVDFKSVAFRANSNAKVDVSIDMAKQPLRFLGALSFVNDLQKYIPDDGFSDPPYLDISTSGIRTGYTLALPNIQLGAFTLSNINLGAEINLPFNGDPLTLRFNFCEKQQPFTLTISALGGGGFFAIEFDMKGLRSLEAALEFGACASIDLGVASGAVSIMGGIYFKMSVSGETKTYELEGYVRINGALSVLGLITASIEFLLTLAAEMKDVGGQQKVARVWGEASLKIKIEIFMFSKTVKLKTSRQFAGAGADPTFTMMISEGEWADYCDSFAA